MDDVTDADYWHAKTVWEDFQIKTFGKYHNLYVWSNTVLRADVLENFGNMSWNIRTWPCTFFYCNRIMARSLINRLK